MNPNLKLHVSQQASMSPQLVASIRLLQLSSLELEQEVVNALESNPLLEAETTEAAPASEAELSFASVVGEGVTQAMDAPPSAEHASEQPAATGSGDIDIDDSFAVSEAWSAAAGDSDDEDDNPMRRAAAPTTGLRATLEAELAAEIEDAETQRAVLALLESIDDAGYLRADLAQLCAAAQAEPAVVRRALVLIRRLAPSGFAARDLRECLLLQLAEVRAGTPGKTLAEQLVMDHLSALGARNREALRVQLGVSPERFAAAMMLIRTLNPKPGQEPNDDAARAIVPDVLVTGAPGAWKLELNPATLPRVRLNRLYEQVLNDAPQGRGLKEKLNEARWLLRGLEMRHDTLLKTTKAIFERQNSFLTQGEVAMKPLTLREVAVAIEMHESTISRVTTNKYVSTPWGVFELKHFFSVSLNAGEAESSGVAVRAMIRQLIDAENPAKPLCDGAISAILLRKGVRVARRTVAKYREGMKIVSAPERKVEPVMAMAV
ncbi:MAG: RNA polymerase factor sigma-54 [Stagnimonas sp.]|nr:RNA polymerase factor sigma-54 [Stagnimonas sp.]